MFGTYRINERKNAVPSLKLIFQTGEINFYICSVKILEGDINSHYHWNHDVMSEAWDSLKAKENLNKIRHQMICDALLDQNIFSGHIK